jgi:hypothetical protein
MKNNVKILILFLFCSSILNAQTIVSTTQENKKAIVEKFTGINCNYCPCADVTINNAISANPENIIVVKVHEGGYANPGAGQPDFRTAYGDAISAQSGNTGNPAISVNRHLFPSYSSNGGTAIGGCYSNASGIALQSPPTYAIDEILLEPAYLNVAADAIIDYSTGTLTVNTEIYYTDSSPNSTNFLQIAIIQDNTMAYQAGSSLAPGGTNYDHDGRLVDLITGQWGEEISSTTIGSFVEKTHTYTLPDNYNGIPVVFEDLKVVVYVTESTQEVINGNRAEMQFDFLSYDLSINSIDSPSLIGNLTESENITVTISNNGDNDMSNFELSYEVDGENITTENFSEILYSGNSLQYTFETAFDFSESGDYSLTVSLSDSNDENLENNSINELITNIGGVDCPDNYALPIVWRENFECHNPFSIENIGEWIVNDLDGEATWGSNAVDFTNESSAFSGLIFNYPLATPVTGDTGVFNTYEGNQGLYFIDAVSTTIQNNDWMISPEFLISGIESPILSFWAKSLTDAYGLETFKVAVGNSDNPDELTVISGSSPVQAPTEWTEFQYDLSSYIGETLRVGINYLGDTSDNDSFIFQMDSFKVEGTLGINDINSLQMKLYPNPADGNYVTIQTSTYGVKQIEVYNLLGKLLLNTEIKTENLDVSLLNEGVYLIKVSIEGKSKISKLIIK